VTTMARDTSHPKTNAAPITGVVIDYSHRPLGAGVLTPPERPWRRASATPRRWHRRGPREMQVAMTELSGVRVTTPLAADPRGFCARLAALGRT